MNYGISRRRVIMLPAALAVATAIGRGARAIDEGPDAVVERLHALLTEVLQQATTLGFSGRFQRLAEGLGSIYDFPLMARLTVGDAWASNDDEQRLRLVETFRAMSVQPTRGASTLGPDRVSISSVSACWTTAVS